MGFGHGHETDLFDGLTSTAQGDIEAPMAKGLDAIWVDVHHQGADFAAGGLADRHGRKRRGTPLLRLTPQAVARTAQRPGLIGATAEEWGIFCGALPVLGRWGLVWLRMKGMT
jgi:hypothetical protein